MSFQLHFNPTGEVLRAARACELDVFLDSFGNTAEQWADEYGPYESDSIFLTITEPGGDAVGTVRMIRPGAAGLKTLVDSGRKPWSVDGVRAARAAGLDPELTWDFATIAVRQGATASGILSSALYRGVHLSVQANSVRWMVMIVDRTIQNLLDFIGFQTTPLPGTGPAAYLGSASSTPLWIDMPKQSDNVRRANPDAHRLIALGIGLEEISFPAFEQFALGRTAPSLAAAGAPSTLSPTPAAAG